MSERNALRRSTQSDSAMRGPSSNDAKKKKKKRKNGGNGAGDGRLDRVRLLKDDGDDDDERSKLPGSAHSTGTTWKDCERRHRFFPLDTKRIFSLDPYSTGMFRRKRPKMTFETDCDADAPSVARRKSGNWYVAMFVRKRRCQGDVELTRTMCTSHVGSIFVETPVEDGSEVRGRHFAPPDSTIPAQWRIVLALGPLKMALEADAICELWSRSPRGVVSETAAGEAISIALDVDGFVDWDAVFLDASLVPRNDDDDAR